MTHTSSEHALTSNNQQGNVDMIVTTQTGPTVTVRELHKPISGLIICMLWVSVWWEQGGGGRGGGGGGGEEEYVGFTND